MVRRAKRIKKKDESVMFTGTENLVIKYSVNKENIDLAPHIAQEVVDMSKMIKDINGKKLKTRTAVDIKIRPGAVHIKLECIEKGHITPYEFDSIRKLKIKLLNLVDLTVVKPEKKEEKMAKDLVDIYNTGEQ